MSGSQEMHYLDESGKKQDASLHAEMLDGVDGSDNEVANNLAYHIEFGGYPEAKAFAYFGTPGGIKLYEQRKASGPASP